MSRISCGKPNQLEEKPNALRRCGDNISIHASVIDSYISQRILLVMGQPSKTVLTLGIVIMRISWSDVLCTQLCHAAYAIWSAPFGHFCPIRIQSISPINSIESKSIRRKHCWCCERLAWAEDLKLSTDCGFQGLFPRISSCPREHSLAIQSTDCNPLQFFRLMWGISSSGGDILHCLLSWALSCY